MHPISPPYPVVSWETRFPKEERGDPLPAGFKVPVVDGPAELLGRILAQSAVDLTNDGLCIVCLMNNRFTAREASGYLREAQRIAIGMRVAGKVAA